LLQFVHRIRDRGEWRLELNTAIDGLTTLYSHVASCGLLEEIEGRVKADSRITSVESMPTVPCLLHSSLVNASSKSEPLPQPSKTTLLSNLPLAIQVRQLTHNVPAMHHIIDAVATANGDEIFHCDVSPQLCERAHWRVADVSCLVQVAGHGLSAIQREILLVANSPPTPEQNEAMFHLRAAETDVSDALVDLRQSLNLLVRAQDALLARVGGLAESMPDRSDAAARFMQDLSLLTRMLRRFSSAKRVVHGRSFQKRADN
jgi:hypothetical protein